MTEPTSPRALVRLAAVAALAFCAPTAASAQQDLANPRSNFADGEPKPEAGWQNLIVRTERGHLIGNPEAAARLVEFVSYTCGHCAAFTREGEPAIEITLLAPGKIGFELRPVIRNALDLTITLLAQCGDPAGFKARHRAFMYSQPQWLAKAQAAPQSQQAVWARGDKAARMNAASALGLANLLVERGQSRSEVDACVMDDAAARKLLASGAADRAEFAIAGTPSFALDGKLIEAHDWASLEPVLAERFAPD